MHHEFKPSTAAELALYLVNIGLHRAYNELSVAAARGKIEAADFDRIAEDALKFIQLIRHDADDYAELDFAKIIEAVETSLKNTFEESKSRALA